MYPVHLHLEVRKNLAIGMNRSKFARDYSNYHSPTAFINAHRQLPADFRRFDIPIDTFAPYGGELTDAQQSVSRSTSPTTFTHRSGVTRTGKGLSIPVVGGPASGYSPGAVAPGTTTKPPPSPSVKPSPGDLLAWVNGQLATYKNVRELVYIDAIPRNPSGKILRRVLKEREPRA